MMKNKNVLAKTIVPWSDGDAWEPAVLYLDGMKSRYYCSCGSWIFIQNKSDENLFHCACGTVFRVKFSKEAA